MWGEGHLYGGGTHGYQRVGSDAQTNQVLMARPWRCVGQGGGTYSCTLSVGSVGGALTTALVGAGVGYTLGTGTTGQHVHLYHPLTLGTGTTGIPIRVTDSFYPTHMMTLRRVG